MYKAYEAAWNSDDFNRGDPYHALRQVLAPEYARLSPEQLEDALAAFLGESSLEDLESFWSNLSRIGRKVATVAQRALPGVVQGATAGSVAGPWGALVGGLAGGALSAARGSSQPRQRPPAQRPTAAPQLPATPTLAAPQPTRPAPMPARAPSGVRPAQGTPAAGQILNLISRPEFQQALMSMLMGSAGQRQASVGNTQAPLGAFTNLLGVLANRASAEYQQVIAGESAGTPEYLLDDAGEFLCDPANPEERADLLWNRLMAAVPEYVEEYDEDSEYVYEEEEYFDEGYDEEYDEEYDVEYEEDYISEREMELQDMEDMYDGMDLIEAYTTEGQEG